ncbi:MAG: Crp/Fnr family transcriptional regulator [Betaproteobacteria bacterium]|nr:MAG: Crp/Fnr family transcriptional regulator [Betaproteobacteria bacterium]
MTDPAEKRLPEPLRRLLPREVQALCAVSTYTHGELLFKQRQKPARMLYVTRGEVVLQRMGRQGEAVVLQRTRHGFVGEASLDSVRYHCDAVVTISGEVIAIPMQAIKQALAADSGFAGRWIAMLNHEVKRLRAQCERLAMRGVKERLLHLIETEGGEGRLPLGSGLKSVAAELGVTHEALYRAVAELEKNGRLRRRENCLIAGEG